MLAFGRVAIGAAAAVVVYLFILAGGDGSFIGPDISPLSYAGILLAAFAAGFSERVLVNVLTSITGNPPADSTTGEDLAEFKEQIETVYDAIDEKLGELEGALSTASKSNRDPGSSIPQTIDETE